MQVTFVGVTTDPDRELCARYGIPIGATATGFQLERLAGRLTLSGPVANGRASLDLDVRHGPFAHRLRTSTRSEPLPRAVGLGRGCTTVVDATAGLGRDAMVLAHLGASVIAIERIPALAALLADATQEAPFRERLQVCCGDATSMLRSWPADQRPDCVYLDPMFHEQGKAQVQKAAQLLRALAAPPADAESLLAAARACARKRVAVKRQPGATPLGGNPDFTQDSGRVRFDVYLCR